MAAVKMKDQGALFGAKRLRPLPLPVTAARIAAAQRMPYLAYPIFRLLVYVYGGETAAVDAVGRMYLPAADAAGKTPQEIVSFRFLHEMMHVIFDDVRAGVAFLASAKGQALKLVGWTDEAINTATNIAMDMRINAMVFPLCTQMAEAEKAKRPHPNWIGAPLNLSWLGYLDLILKGQKSPPKPSNASSPSGGGGAGQKQKPMTSPKTPDEGHEAIRQMLAGSMTSPDGMDLLLIELPEGKGGNGEELGVEDLGPMQLTVLQHKAAADIKRAAERKRGSVPAGLLLWAEERLTKAKVHWTRHLRCTWASIIASIKGRDDRTWSRLSKLTWAMPGRVVSAGTVARKQKIGVVVDSSGSMGDFRKKNPLHAVSSELWAIAQDPSLEVWTTFVDSAATKPKRLRTLKEFSDALAGGGGTDMRVGIERILADVKPSMVLVLTDGFTPWPESMPPGVKLIAGITCRNGADVESLAPDYATVVAIPLDDEDDA